MAKTGTVLAREVLAKVPDPKLYPTDAIELMNECLNLMAGELDLSHLNTVGTVTTVLDEDAALLPDNCTQGIYLATVDGFKVDVYDSYADMYLALNEATGSIQGVAVDGVYLRYLPIPSEEKAVTIYYHRGITPITPSTAQDLFTGREVFNGENAMVHYAAYKLWDDIEDGLEGAKVNTNTHERRFNSFWRKCKAIIRQGPGRPTAPRNKLW